MVTCLRDICKSWEAQIIHQHVTCNIKREKKKLEEESRGKCSPKAQGMLPTTPCHPWTGPHPGVLFAFSSFSGTKFCPLGLLQLSVYGGSEDCCQPTPKSVDSYKQKKISIICVPRGVSTVFCFFREDSR